MAINKSLIRIDHICYYSHHFTFPPTTSQSAEIQLLSPRFCLQCVLLRSRECTWKFTWQFWVIITLSGAFTSWATPIFFILAPLGFCSLCLCVYFPISLFSYLFVLLFLSPTPLSPWGFLFLYLYNVVFLRIPYLFTIMSLTTHILSWCNLKIQP